MKMKKTKLLSPWSPWFGRDSKAVRGWEGLMMEKGSPWIVCYWPVHTGVSDKKQWSSVIVRVCVCFIFCDCFWDRKRDRSYRGCWDVGF